MKKHKNAPIKQAQNLLKGHKMETLEREVEDILAATSKYYSEALKKLADGEPSGGNEG